MSLPRARLVLGLLVVSCGGQLAHAEDPETLVARRHYERGVQLYEAQRYDEACEELETARRVLSVPALDYNVAKCQERRQRWDLAIDAYERFLERVRDTDPMTTAEVRTQLRVLRDRINARALEGYHARRRRLRIAGFTLAASAVVLAGVATGVYLSAWGEYQAQRTVCGLQPCAPSDYQGLTDRVHAAQAAGYALWALSGVAAAAGIGVWIVHALVKKPQTQAWIAPFGAGAAVGGAF